MSSPLLEITREAVEAFRARAALSGEERRQSVVARLAQHIAANRMPLEAVLHALVQAVFDGAEAVRWRAEVERLRGANESLRDENDRLDLDVQGFRAELAAAIEEATAREVEISRLRGRLAERPEPFTPPVRADLVPVDTADEVAPRKPRSRRADKAAQP